MISKRSAGFTLVEVLIVLTLLAVVASMAFPRLRMSFQDQVWVQDQAKLEALVQRAGRLARLHGCVMVVYATDGDAELWRAEMLRAGPSGEVAAPGATRFAEFAISELGIAADLPNSSTDATDRLRPTVLWTFQGPIQLLDLIATASLDEGTLLEYSGDPIVIGSNGTTNEGSLRIRRESGNGTSRYAELRTDVDARVVEWEEL